MTGRRLLIINRGAIATQVRDIAFNMGFDVHLVYQSEDCSHIKPGFKAHLVSSYVDEAAILSLIQTHEIDWVHPGYGFLSESGAFAAKVIALGCGWVGPNPGIVSDFEDKYQTKLMAQALHIPVLVATTHAHEAREWQKPIMVKAKCGGGGRAMRLVHDMNDLDKVVRLISGEAQERFSNDEVFFEPYIESARHIEVQLMGDHQGRVVAVGDRDCSVQRRHQKVIEMAPALGLSPDERLAMHQDAIKLGQNVGLTACATVEFLFDVKARQHWLIEVNPRIQVEHEVTEKVTQINLIEWQLKIALGGCIPESFDHIEPKGYAMQARVYAENPAQHDALSFGQLERFSWDEGCVNVTWRPNAQKDDMIDGRFDPMLLKVIAQDQDPKTAQDHLLNGLRRCFIAGVMTNRDALIQWVQAFDWVTLPNTQWLGNQKFEQNKHVIRVAQVAMLFLDAEQTRMPALVSMPNGWRIMGPYWYTAVQHISGQAVNITYRWLRKDQLQLACGTSVHLIGISAEVITLLIDDEHYIFHWAQLSKKARSFINETTSIVIEKASRKKDYEQAKEGKQLLKALLPGRVVASHVFANKSVSMGEVLFVVEAMKMHHEIKAEQDGVVASAYVQVNDHVQQNQVLLEWEQEDAIIQ